MSAETARSATGDPAARQSLTEEVIENVLRQASLVSMDEPGAWLLSVAVAHLRHSDGLSLRQALTVAARALRTTYALPPEQGERFEASVVGVVGDGRAEIGRVR